MDCFEGGGGSCPIQSACTLQHMLRRGLNAFLGVLDQYTVEDLLTNRVALDGILGPGTRPRAGHS